MSHSWQQATTFFWTRYLVHGTHKGLRKFNWGLYVVSKGIRVLNNYRQIFSSQMSLSNTIIGQYFCCWQKTKNHNIIDFSGSPSNVFPNTRIFCPHHRIFFPSADNSKIRKFELLLRTSSPDVTIWSRDGKKKEKKKKNLFFAIFSSFKRSICSSRTTQRTHDICGQGNVAHANLVRF